MDEKDSIAEQIERSKKNIDELPQWMKDNMVMATASFPKSSDALYKEISELKAKNKELEAARNDLFNQGIYLMEDQVKLLDALEETNNYLAKDQHGTEKGSLIARNKNIITKYRG